MVERQRTIAQPVSLSGVGLHTGTHSKLTLLPAPPDTWIEFRRVDLKDKPMVKALFRNVVNFARGTTLEYNGVKVITVEHLLAAICGLRVDNIIVELEGEEIPVLDGSSYPFVEAILNAGIVEQDRNKNYFKIDKPIGYSDNTNKVDIQALPLDWFRVTFMIDYPSTSIGTEYVTLDSLSNDFVDKFSRARTFCLLSEVEPLLKEGLIKGGDLNSAIVVADVKLTEEHKALLRHKLGIDRVFIDQKGILNGIELRYEDEPCRHKVVDLLGDLALLGFPIKGHIIAVRSGHKSNASLVEKIYKAYKTRTKTGAPRISSDQEPLLDITDIEKILPHRYPFLLVDKILEVEAEKRVIAVKNVTRNEPFFNGHFPGHPIMPGVLIIETMAQAGGFLLLNTIENPENKVVYFLGVDKVRFRHKVIPGDQLIINVEMINRRGSTCKFTGKAFVGDKLACEAEMLATIVDKDKE